MNMELYITVLETSVSHLEKLQALLSAKNRDCACYSDSAAEKKSEEVVKEVLKEILDTVSKVEIKTKEVLRRE